MCLFDARHHFSIFLCDVRRILRILDEQLLVCAQELRAWMRCGTVILQVFTERLKGVLVPLYGGGWVMKCLYGMTVSNTVFCCSYE